MSRVYLDWNATAPLRPEARDAMVAAMELLGNPSSVHAEGRAAKAILERARAQVATAFGADGSEIIFTSSATEAAALALKDRELHNAGIEHDCVSAWGNDVLQSDADGLVRVTDPSQTTLQHANSETGVIQHLSENLAVADFVQSFGKLPTAFNWTGVDMGLLSGHKIGGPKGVGALVLRQGLDIKPLILGGGQEQNRRAGTENVVGIAGFGAAAEAASRDLEAGLWDKVRTIRDRFEATIVSQAPETVFFGQNVDRLPNTSYFGVAGWKGETQVMQMDLAGFAISAGSACSSGKVKSSRVLKAMGQGQILSGSAIRVSIGPSTSETDLMRFADAWVAEYKRFMVRAA